MGVPHHDQRLRQVYLHTLATPGVWLFTLVSLVAALLPDVVIRQKFFNIYFPHSPIHALFINLISLINTQTFIEAALQGAEETLDNN